MQIFIKKNSTHEQLNKKIAHIFRYQLNKRNFDAMNSAAVFA